MPLLELWCSNAAAGASPHRCTASKQLWCSMPLRAASLHRCTAWKQLWCSNATAGCQSAQLGSSFGAQMPLRAASSHRLQAPKSSFGAQKPLQAACRHRLEAALVLKCRCGLPARTAWKQLLVLICHCGLRVRTAWKRLWWSNAAVGCQPALLGSSFGAQMPLRAVRPYHVEAASSPYCVEAALLLKCRCGLPARAGLEAALVLECRCGLQACTA